MNNTARQKFIFSAILAYMVLALLWIFMSDRLLAVFTDISAMVWLSMIKGVLFVVVSAAFFYIVLGAVPPAQPSLSASHWLDAVSAGVSPGRLPRWSTYLLAVILTLLVVLVRQNIAADFAQRPLLMLLMFPIIVSALFGGLGPGLV
ncbi:diguanylate cyclase, partial [bacterium]|nr:diguanylate cyclase [bacterium]